VTATKNKSGCYYASVQVEVDMPEPKFGRTEVTVGVDMGLKDFAVTSDAVKISVPKYLQKSEKRLARLQRHLSRRQKGSKGRENAQIAVARQHEHVANQRSDFLHKTSRWLVETYGLIGIEDLNVMGIVKTAGCRKQFQTLAGASSGDN
jgi:putative transposase